MKESTTEYSTEYMTHFFYQMVLIRGFPVKVRLRPPCSLFGKRWQWSPEWVWKLGIYYPQSQWQLGINVLDEMAVSPNKSDIIW